VVPVSGSYRGLPGAVLYAYRNAGSRLFRSFVVVGAVVSLLLLFLFASGLVALIADTASARGGRFTVLRAFYVVVLLGLVAPVLAPILVVARRRRRGSADGGGERAIALAGYGYLFALYVGAGVVGAPDANEPAETGALGPVVAWLNGLPDAAGFVLPVVAALVVAAVVR